MKTIFLNGSPRKNWNTALMLKEAQKGAESVGAETEYIDLFDLTYTGCRSCMACKRKGGERCHCFWKDDLSPVIDRIFDADALIIGSPIYLGDITSQVHGLIERLHFCALSYDNYSNYFTGRRRNHPDSVHRYLLRMIPDRAAMVLPELWQTFFGP